MFLILCVIGSAVAMADWKQYAYTTDYTTLDKGELEIEAYTQYQSKGSNYTFQNQVEFEWGALDQLTLALYDVLESTQSTSYQHKKLKLEAKYAFLKPKTFIVDPALYVEYAVDREGVSAIEFKGIFSKALGSYRIVTNLITEKELKDGSTWENSYSVGVSTFLNPRLIVSIEMQGTFDSSAPTLFIAPGIAYLQDQLKVNLSVGKGLNSNSQDLYIRNIVSYEF